MLLAGWLVLGMALRNPGRAEDPPRRVGSLNYLSGEVSYVLRTEPGEPDAAATQNWLPADFNQPVCQDMSLQTGALARARVRIGADAIELSDDTALNMLNLTERLIEASVPRGRVFLQLTTLDPGESVEIETPRGSLWVLEAGAYDIDIGGADRPTRIVVLDGKARFVGGAADLPIAAGKAAEISGAYPAVAAALHDWTGLDPTHPSPPPAADKPATPDAQPSAPRSQPPTPAGSAASGNQAPGGQTLGPAGAPAAPAPAAIASQAIASQPAGNPPSATKPAAVAGGSGDGASDPFLLWVEQSNEDQPAAPRPDPYVSAETTGSDDLDRYGSWSTLPDSEPVWFPASVPQDWAPYRFGHWDQIPPWGWTWIDDQPWGFAPFHYGRWVMIDGRWGWLPGAVDPHPVYAPALVAFVDAPDDGGGPAGGPDVAWFPLGPGDDYAPWYPTGPAYVAAINAPEHGHFRDFDRHGDGGRARTLWRAQYFNRRFATVVSRQALADAHRIDRQMVRRMDPGRLEGAAVMHGAPRITPAALRTEAATGEFRGGPRGMAPPAGAVSGFHPRPGGGAAGERGPAAAARAPERAGAARQFGGAQGFRGSPQGFRAAAPQQFGRPEATQGFRPGTPQQFGRPEASQGFRPGTPQQFGRPEAAQGFHPGMPQQFGRPEATQGFRPGMPQQFGRPAAAQGFRGVPQFGRPQAFQTPAASARGIGALGRAAARPAPQTGGGGRHK